MDALMDKLARLEALEKAATPRPWYAIGTGVGTWTNDLHWKVCDQPLADTEGNILGFGKRDNADLIVAQRSAVPVLAAFLRKMLEEHVQRDPDMGGKVRGFCRTCSRPVPCPTRQAAERALEELP